MIYELSSVFLLINLNPMISKNQYHHIPLHQWEFQDPKMEVPTPRIWPYMVLTYLHQLDPGDLPLITFLEIYPITWVIWAVSGPWKSLNVWTTPPSWLAKQLTPQPIDDVEWDSGWCFGIFWNGGAWWESPSSCLILRFKYQKAWIHSIIFINILQNYIPVSSTWNPYMF